MIIGAGPAGLTAALELQAAGVTDITVIEADGQVGGISRTVNFKNNRIDIGGHRFFSKSDWVMNWWADVLPIAADQADTELNMRYRGQTRSACLNAPLRTTRRHCLTADFARSCRHLRGEGTLFTTSAAVERLAGSGDISVIFRLDADSPAGRQHLECRRRIQSHLRRL
ncbi:MAG: NAD(P)-binding protein [Burkholderiaceae bacterium]|nr:NAD(P)-binding protein [Burkholderiaceae bacterium]